MDGWKKVKRWKLSELELRRMFERKEKRHFGVTCAPYLI